MSATPSGTHGSDVVRQMNGPGRRERKKRDTRRRIVEAAQTLFARDGYGAVTTQQIAQAADIGTGTLFRYAGSKAELLIMVMNEELRLGAQQGLGIAERGGTSADAIYGLIEPLVLASLAQPENTSVFQREVLFGADGPYRSQALERIHELEETMVTVLDRCAPDTPSNRRIAEVIFSVVYLKLVRLELGRVSPEDLPEVLRSDIGRLLSDLCSMHPDSAAPDQDESHQGTSGECSSHSLSYPVDTMGE
jgi:TetR/AcrR family transcriptional regulator, cholesterol catabolism regulator